MSLVKIEYSNSSNIGKIVYPVFNYSNWFWIDVDIKKPTYPIRRESEEDDYGNVKHTFQRWDKVYTLELYVTEVMADFLSLIPLHDNIIITFPNGATSRCNDFNVSLTWQNISSVALCVITFSTNYVVLNGINSVCS